MNTFRKRVRSASGLFLLALIAAIPAQAQAGAVLSDNLSALTGGTETAQGDNWLAASFGTDTSAYSLTSATILLANTDPGMAEVSLYSDGGLQPGTFLGALNSPANIASSLQEISFTTSGLLLSANSTYWIVLSATSGSFDWGWATDNSGSGVGFQHAWGTSPDAGLTWFTDDIYPLQLSVTATAVPEPSTLVLVATGAISLVLCGRHGSGSRRDRQPPKQIDRDTHHS